MVAHALSLVLATAVALPAAAEVRVVCPLRAVTRIVLPEALQQLRISSAARDALGVSVERTAPQGVLRVEPRQPGRARVEWHGPTLRLRLTLETAATGRDGEVRVAHDGAVEARPADVAPSPETVLAPSDTRTSVPPSAAAKPALPEAPAAHAAVSGPPAAEPSPAALAFDVGTLMRAAPVRIGRREGLPGQKRMLLVDALRGDEHLWLRFTLEDGASARVRAVTWEAGAIETYTQEPVGRDLRVVVQLPRAPVTRKTRVVLALDSGAEYRFALSRGTLADLWRKLFN